MNVIFYYLLAPTSGNMYQIGTRILCVECRDDGICSQSQPLPWLPLQTEEARWSHRCSQCQPTGNSKCKNDRLLFLSLIWSHCSYSLFFFSCTCKSDYIYFTNETKMIYMDLYNNYILKHLYWVFLNMLNMLFELWNFSIVVLEWYIILFTLIISTHCYQNAFTMRSYVICTIIFSEKKESSIRTSKYAEEDQTENVILRSLKILLLKCVCIQRPQSFKRNVFHWEHIPVHVLDIAVTMDSYWSLGRLSFIKNASVRVS